MLLQVKLGEQVRSVIQTTCYCCWFSPVFSLFSSTDDVCKSKNQAKREKRRPPGTVEFVVSGATLPVGRRGERRRFLQESVCLAAGGSERFPQQHRAQVQHHPQQAGAAQQALLSQCLPRSGKIPHHHHHHAASRSSSLLFDQLTTVGSSLSLTEAVCPRCEPVRHGSKVSELSVLHKWFISGVTCK